MRFLLCILSVTSAQKKFTIGYRLDWRKKQSEKIEYFLGVISSPDKALDFHPCAVKIHVLVTKTRE